MKRFPPVAVALLAGLAFAPSSAAAAPCGEPDPETGVPARATLTLDEDSVASIAYGRETDGRTLLLRFRAAGCDLAATGADPEIELLPKEGADELPGGVVSLIRARRDGAEFSVRLAVDPARFDPGSYAGFVELRAPDLTTTRTPVAITRSEDNMLWPLLIGVIGGLAGLAWFALLSTAKSAVKPLGVVHFAGVFVAAAAAGIISVGSQYLDQEVWSLGDNGLAALMAAFTGATTGAMATAISVLWGAPAARPETTAEEAPRAEALR